MSWRARFVRKIESVLSAHPEPARDEALRRAYPLAPPWRGGPAYPYRIWRDEIARQLGRKPPLTRHPGGCGYTLGLFDRRPCPYTVDLFEG